MVPAVYALVALGLALTVLRARPAVALAVLAVAILVVPAPLQVPFTGARYVTFHHLLTLAGVARLGLSRRRPTVIAPQVALVVLILIALIAGIAVAPEAGPLDAARFRMVSLLDQVAFLSVALLLARQAGARAVVSAAAIAVLVGSAVAAAEHLTAGSLGHALFSPFPLGQGLSAAFPLAARLDSRRVRAGAEFALQFGWLVVAFTPALIVMARRWGGRRYGVLLASAGLVACVASVYWSFSRSALVAVVGAALLTVLLLRDRVLIALVGGASGLAAIAAVVVPAVTAHLAIESGAGSLAVRGQRLAPAMEVASRHPYRGTGLGQLITAGFPTTDQAFLLEYVELGVLGAVALVVVLASALQLVGRALLAAPEEDRDLAVAAAVGVLAFVASCFAYDAFTLEQGTHQLWLFAAAAAVMIRSDRVARVPLLARATSVGAIGLLVGTIVLAVAPAHSAQRFVFTTVPLQVEAERTYDNVTIAKVLVTTVCEAVRAGARDDERVDCSDSFRAAGTGFLRVQAATPYALKRAVGRLTALARDSAEVRYLQVVPIEPPRTGSDTWAATAPVWLALGGFGLSALWRPRGRRSEPAPPHSGHGAEPWPPAPPTPVENVLAGR